MGLIAPVMLNRGWASVAALRVLLVTDVQHATRRLATMLEVEPRTDLLGCAAELTSLPALLMRGPVDAVLIDLPATRANLERVAEMTVRWPATRFIAIGAVEVDDAMAWAEAGMAGFVQTRDSVEELLAVLETAMAGELLCSPELGSALLRRVRELGRERPAAQLARLTAREQEIVVLIGEGLPNAEIAQRTALRLPTVKNHVRSIMQKLQVRTREEAGALAVGARRPPR